MDAQTLMSKAYGMYAELDPRDRRDARWYMSDDTKKIIGMHYATHRGDDFAKVQQMFGLPIEIVDGLPLGTLELLAETDLDRALRRAARKGLTVNIMPPLEIPLDFPAPPAPTLKALLKHWWKKVKR